MNIIMTPTQNYNDLKALVKRSYTDENERNEIWEYIASYVLSPDRTQIQEERLEDFTAFLGHEGRLAHIDIVVNALDPDKCDDERCNLFVHAIEKAHPNPWASFCYGETIGTDHELTRFFYIEKEK